MVAAGRGGRDGRRSGAGKVDDGGDEARGRRRWMGWRTEAGVGMGCSRADSV